ncbi:MAG: hypothetical protein AAFX39_17600 [Pseudomonadota bacterium]
MTIVVLDAGHLLLTPHVGDLSRQTLRLFDHQTVEAIRPWKTGNPIRLLAS